MRISQLGTGEQFSVPSTKTKFDFPGTKLLIGIPTRGQCSVEFAASLAAACCLLNAAHVAITIVKGQNSCAVDLNRNKLLSRFMQTDYTHILMIDDDMGFDPMAPLHMINCNRDFVAAAGNLKTDEGKDYACKIFTAADETPLVDEAGLIRASHVGGAFILLKRVMVQRMMDEYPDLKNEFVDSGTGFRLFEFAYTKDAWISEDYNFCERWTRIGGQIWIYPNVSFVHSGSKNYNGNYHEFLISLKQPETMSSPEPEPAPRKNFIVSAVEKVMLSEAYIRRVAEQVISLQNEGKK